MDATLLDIVLIVGFATRLIRLAVVDLIAEGLRIFAVRIAGRRGDRPARWTLALVQCPHCIGFWLSAGVVASWLAWGNTVAWQAVAGTFTLAYVAGHLVARLDTDPEE